MCPTGKSISVSVAVQCVCACVRACVRAKLCAGVRTMIPPGLGRKIGSLWGCARPGARCPPPPRALSKIKNKTLVLSGSDRIRTRSYSRGVFPMGFRPQKSLKFRVPLPPRRPRPPGPNGPAGGWGGFQARWRCLRDALRILRGALEVP